jgi:hypothetical protein
MRIVWNDASTKHTEGAIARCKLNEIPFNMDMNNTKTRNATDLFSTLEQLIKLCKMGFLSLGRSEVSPRMMCSNGCLRSMAT